LRLSFSVVPQESGDYSGRLFAGNNPFAGSFSRSSLVGCGVDPRCFFRSTPVREHCSDCGLALVSAVVVAAAAASRLVRCCRSVCLQRSLELFRSPYGGMRVIRPFVSFWLVSLRPPVSFWLVSLRPMRRRWSFARIPSVRYLWSEDRDMCFASFWMGEGLVEAFFRW